MALYDQPLVVRDEADELRLNFGARVNKQAPVYSLSK